MNENKDLVYNKIRKEQYEKLLKTVYKNDEIDNVKKLQIIKIIIDKYNKNLNTNNTSALLIGINYYGTNIQLNGCIDDANNIKKFLETKKFNNIKLLTDDTLSIKKPTKTNITDELIRTLINSKSGDTIVIMYSGHGSYCLDKNNDELRGYDQMIISCDFKRIKDDELKSIIYKYLKKDVTLFCLFDSCYSGSVLDLRYQYSDTLNENKLTINNKEKETRGNIIMISGCDDEQTSADALINGKYNGAMTAAFLYCCNNIPQKNLTWNNLLLGMRKYLKKNGYTQIPQLSSGKPINTNSSVCF